MLVSFNDDLLARFDARPEHRAELQALQSQIEGFSVLATREGLLSLDDEIHWISDPLLRTGLRAIVDGIFFDGKSPNDLQQWLLALLVSEARTGLALIRQLIISEGLITIWRGDDPEPGRLLLEAYLGTAHGVAK